MRILHQTPDILVVQTLAGEHFDKFHTDNPYGDFNMGLHVGDDARQVLQNRALVLDELSKLANQPISQIHWLNQVHGNQVKNTNEPLVLSASNADAVISHKTGVGLSIMTADCVPIVLYDQNGQATACIHAGWQGLVNGVLAKTVEQLSLTADSQLVGLIGACISRQSYEVGLSLAERIVSEVVANDLVSLNADELTAQIVWRLDDEKALLDLVALTKLQLARHQIKLIDMPIACSYQDSQLYSYRAQTHAKQPATGRMATIVVRLK